MLACGERSGYGWSSMGPVRAPGADAALSEAPLFGLSEKPIRTFSGPKRAPASEVLRDVHAAQLSARFRQMPIALALNVVNAAIIVLVLQRLVPLTIPLAWFCTVSLLTLGRWALWRRYRHHSPIGDGPYWSLLAICGSLAAGLTWGLGGVVLFPIARADPSYFRHRRHVRRRGGAQRFALSDPICLPAHGKLAYGGPIFVWGHTDGKRIRRDDFGLCSGTLPGGRTAQPDLRRNDASAFRTP
jgi:hypothetical protein